MWNIGSRFHNIKAGRIHHDELIWMEAGSRFLLLDELPARLKSANDLTTFGQVIHLIATIGMRLDR